MDPLDIVYMVFFGVMIFSSVLWMLVFFMNREEVYSVPDPSSLPSVAFLVPAYNEEEYIEDTLSSLLDLDYPAEKLEIIAINDGSTDSTLERMRKFEDDVTIIDKENTGKANSLNVALEQVDADVVACMDADSYPEEDFLNKMVGYFDREGVKGITPALKIRHTGNWVEKIQWTEYVFQIFLRKMFALFDVQYVLPGPGSLYDADYLKQIGGWDEETLTEDMEVAFRIVSKGERIDNSANAFVHTEPPSSLRGLFRQRIRWYRGYIENFIRYRHLLGKRRHGNIGMFFLPFNVIWLLLVVFFSLHFLYNLFVTALQVIDVYRLTGSFLFSFNVGLQNVNFFHLFAAYFFLIGVGTILISLKVSEEPILPWKRKTHYALFLAIYPLLFAFFWIAAVVEHVAAGDRRW